MQSQLAILLPIPERLSSPPINPLLYSFLSADHGIVFERDCALYGRHGLDYINIIPYTNVLTI
jgi:hypothetical protein